MTRSSCWAVAFALQALVLPVLGIARDGQVCESSGGRSVTFTTTEATELSLDISPDGKTLVFDLLGDLYTVPVAGGKATRLVGSGAWEVRPVWSPEGLWIAYIRDRSGREQVYDVEETNEKI